MLGVKLDTPDHILPRGKISVPVTINGLAAGETAHLTLAAVDEGILQLTKFKTPAPSDWYFAKRQLGIAMRDDYGRLLQSDALAGAIRQGGDAASIGGKGLEVVPTRTVALFSGILETDAQGHATVDLDIPDFQGELRLMAVAWNHARLGSGDAALKVRDPVIADLTLPRFLAPGDSAEATLLIHNVDGVSGSYSVALSGSDAVSFDGTVAESIDLAQGAQEIRHRTLKGNAVGIGKITLQLRGPNGYAVDRDWQIAVRGAQSPSTSDLTTVIRPGETSELDHGLLKDYVPGSTHVGLSVSTWKAFNVPALLGALDRYPYGCLEQTTSRAFPLLYLNELSAASGGKVQAKPRPQGWWFFAPSDGTSVDDRVQEAVYRVLDMQRSQGNFGLWGPRDEAYSWLSVYALDFLHEAKRTGRVVPAAALQRGDAWLKGIAAGTNYGGDDWDLGRTRAYAFYVLAREGQASIGDLRYFHDNVAKRFDTALPAGDLGAALLLAGDRARATHVLGLIGGTLDGAVGKDHYASRIRDLSGLATVMATAGDTTVLPSVIEKLSSVDYGSGDPRPRRWPGW